VLLAFLAFRRDREEKLVQYSTKALLLFGDAASFAQWDSLSSTWALQGQQPEVPPSGKCKPRHDLRYMGVQFSPPYLAHISFTSNHAVPRQDDACEA
jgi:hypothetical protein